MYKENIHYDEPIENAILGVCIAEMDGMARVRQILEPEHFYLERNKAVYKLLCEMWDEAEMIDLIIISGELVRRGYWKFDDKASYYCTRLTMSVVSSAHVEMHAVILRQLFANREILRIQKEADKGDEDGVAKLSNLQDQINDILNLKTTDDWHDMSFVMMKLTQYMDKVKGKDCIGIPTGFKIIDKVSYGLEDGELIIIGARPSVGKTALVGNIALNIAKTGKKVGIISLEMPEEKIGGRIAAIYADVEFWKIYKNRFVNSEEERVVMDRIANLATMPIYFSDRANVTISDIRSKAYRLKKKNQLDILMIDYLQLIESANVKPSANREQEVAKLSRGLKMMAMDMKIPIVILCQLNRQSEARNNKRPKMSDLRESGSLEQNADKVIILHRDWKSGILQDEMGNSTERQATIILDKNRNGECLEIILGFDPDKMKFFEVENAGVKKIIPQQSSNNYSQGNFGDEDPEF